MRALNMDRTKLLQGIHDPLPTTGRCAQRRLRAHCTAAGLPRLYFTDSATRCVTPHFARHTHQTRRDCSLRARLAPSTTNCILHFTYTWPSHPAPTTPPPLPTGHASAPTPTILPVCLADYAITRCPTPTPCRAHHYFLTSITPACSSCYGRNLPSFIPTTYVLYYNTQISKYSPTTIYYM